MIDHTSPAIVIPCDDRLVWQLHDLHQSRPQLRDLIETSLGSADSFETVRSRHRTLALASRLGVRCPETREIRGEDDIREWFADLPGRAVMKLDGTWGGRGVDFVSSSKEGMSAWRKFTRDAPPGAAWKQRFINRDPLAFWKGSGALQRSITVQRFIAGRPANAMIACWRGQVLGMAFVEVLCSQGPSGASTVVRLSHHPEAVLAATRMAHKLRLSGFFGLDFIIEACTGAAYMIELNPRCTQLGHLLLPGQGDLAGLVCAKLGARGPVSSEAPVRGDTIALFPQALAWNPDSPYLANCHHDVPWTEPALVRELLLPDSWAERRLIARAYHWLRGRDRNPVPDREAFSRLAIGEGWSGPDDEPPARNGTHWRKI